MAVAPKDIADELARSAPDSDTPLHRQWAKWIDRAHRAIEARARRLAVRMADLDREAVEDVVTMAVARRVSRPIDNAESVTDQAQVDDSSVNQTRRYGKDVGVHITEQEWAHVGLTEPAAESWSGSVAYSSGRC